jgi:hypothetical protein
MGYVAERRIPYEERRPWTVPETLAELTGPTSGVVELPKHLDWSEMGQYNLDDPAELGLMYERVIRESMRVDDLRSFLNGATLRRVWDRIFLPRTVRRLWEARFPDLHPTA